MRHARLTILVVVALGLALIATSPAAFAQDSAPDQPPPVSTSVVTPSASPVQPPVRMGGCDTNGVIVSSPFVPRNSDIEWWAWGFAVGTSVGVQVIDPAGRSYSIGSTAVDNICEASGMLLSENRTVGAYTIVVTGTKSGGGPVDVSTTFNLVSFSMNQSAVPTPGLQAPPAPNRPGGIRATALGSNSIRIDWTDNSDNETGFRIDSDAGQFRVGSNITTFNAGGLQPSTVYCFSVYSVSAAGESFGGTNCAQTAPRQ